MTTDTTILDKLIADIDAVMSGEAPGAAGTGEFKPEVMADLRALVLAARAT